MGRQALGAIALAWAVAVAVAGCSSGTTSTSTAGTGVPATVGAGATSSSRTPATLGTTTTGPGTTSEAPCTKEDLLGAVTAQDASVTDLSTFACDGSWAYAIATTSTGVLLLEANGPRWSVVPTAPTCQGTTVPADIRAAACAGG